jgi:predicted nucleotide-binding protein (sugar kinase/HSP70/actin superfamily)
MGDNNYNCPVVAYYPELLAANIARLKETRFLDPYFGLHRPKDFARAGREVFRKKSSASRRARPARWQSGRTGPTDDYRSAVARMGEALHPLGAGTRCEDPLSWRGRPYHNGPGDQPRDQRADHRLRLCAVDEGRRRVPDGQEPRKC